MLKRMGLAAMLGLVLISCALSAYAAGPLGVYGGSEPISQLQSAHVGWVRYPIRLPSGHTAWDQSAFDHYDSAIANLVNAGIQVVMLINHESYVPASYPSSWNVNAVETGGSNGNNSQINNFAQNFAVPIILHYKDRGVKCFEIWNEPNGQIYASCYASILTEVYCRLHYANGHTPGVVIIGGSMYGWGNEWGVYNSANAGADYLDSVYNMGKTRGAWDYCKNTFGSYPLDAVAQHVYLNTTDPDALTQTNFQNYLDYVHNVLVKYGDGNKKTYITEWGFESSCDGGRCNQTNQSNGLKTGFAAIISKSYVKESNWYRYEDVGDGEYFGLTTNPTNYTHKDCWQYFTNRATYEGKRSDGTVNTIMQNYFNNNGGQAVYGNPYDNGGSAWVHQWSGNNHWANVQDYDGGSLGKCCLFENGKGWSVEMNNNHGFWDYYLGHGGIGYFDAPMENEHTIDGSTWEQQCYAHTLYWNAANGVWAQ